VEPDAERTDSLAEGPGEDLQIPPHDLLGAGTGDRKQLKRLGQMLNVAM
jgi:hypothetical protein